MQLNCQRQDLIEGLSMVTRVISTRTTMPILEGVHMLAEEDTLTLACTDMNTAIQVTIPALIEREGQVVLPGRLLSDMVRRMPEGDISIQVSDRHAAVLRAGGSRSTISGYAGVEFPQLPTVERDRGFSLPQPLLKDMISQTAFAIATEEARPILTGCLLETGENDVHLVALDGFRLALRHERVEGNLPTLSAVVPGKALNELARVLSDDGEAEVHISLGASHMLAEMQNALIISRLLDGEFIRYQQILPKDWKTRIRVNKDEFAQSIDRAALIARDGKTNLIRLSVSENLLTVDANAEVGDVHEELPIVCEGEDVRIAFNVKFLSDVAKVLDDEEICLRFNNEVSPCVIVPVEGDRFIYLVLPVRTI